MKFIYADCLDYIDPRYDFINDCNGKGRQKYWDDRFAHEYMDKPPYDGILVSRGIVGDHRQNGKYSESESMRFRREGARKFLRYPEDKYPGSMVIGDCGAFQYVSLPEPPYTAEDMMEFYADGGFTHGSSVDHIIFQFDPGLDQMGFEGSHVPDEIRSRYEITLRLAEDFFRLSKNLKRNFTPLGVVQGWSPLSMAKAARSLVSMGYDYLAVGGLVPLKTEYIHRALSAIRDAIPQNTRIHLLGFAKADQLDEFVRYNISSFDSSSPMIKAFKDDKKNYYLTNGSNSITYYKAIRIPQASENNTLRKKIKTGKCRQEELLSKEADALTCIRRYAKYNAGIEETVDALKAYSSMMIWDDQSDDSRNSNRLEKLCQEYAKTLADRPWERCQCRVCRESGIEVIIFRSSNRNKRRGMHNLEIYYNHLRNLNNQLWAKN